MVASDRTLLRLVREIARADDRDVSLASLAQLSNCSPFHLQRRFKRFTGETPRQFAQRIRLERAAAELAASDATILEIALDAGFQSHEVFSRAFRKRFGKSPRDYRRSVCFGPDQARRRRAIVQSVVPCIGLYRMESNSIGRRNGMDRLEIEKRTLEQEQPILFIQRRLSFAELQQAMGECYGALYGYGASAGLAIGGHPMARYVATGPGLWTVDLIMPLLAPAEPNGEMQAGTLVSGPVAFAVHHGPYDGLPGTNAAIERWIEDNGHEVGGAPWESFVTDPGETPDPADWRTEIFWPLKA